MTAWRRPAARVVVAALAALLFAGGVTLSSKRDDRAISARPSDPISIAAAQRADRIPASGGPCGRKPFRPAVVPHVLWLWMENKSDVDIVGSPAAPYLNQLAEQCALATNYRALTHPSLPNYIATTSGLPLSALSVFATSCIPSAACSVAGTGMFGVVPSWRAYQESMPERCFKGDNGTYVVRHNPPAYYRDLTTCATFDVRYGELAADLAADRLPAFGFITPNNCNNMHDCPVETGDAWLAAEIPKIVSSKAYLEGRVVLIVTFDEGHGGAVGVDCLANPDPTCLVTTIVVAPWMVPGTRVGAPFTHYSLLRTTLELLGLPPNLGLAATATSMRDPFNL